MAITTRCPSCNLLIKAPENTEGKTARCPKCHEKFVIHAKSSGEVPPPVGRTARNADMVSDMLAEASRPAGRSDLGLPTSRSEDRINLSEDVMRRESMQYAQPAAIPDETVQGDVNVLVQRKYMEERIKACGRIYYVLCGATIFGALVLLYFLWDDYRVARPVNPSWWIKAFVACALHATIDLVVAYGIYSFKRWGRICGIILSILYLPTIPIGTAVGIYCLSILLKKDAKMMCTR